jgi:protein TonB
MGERGPVPPGGIGALVRLLPWMMPAAGCIAAALFGLAILIGTISSELPPNKGAITVTLLPPPKPAPPPEHIAPKLAPVIRPLRPKPRVRPKPPRRVRRAPLEKPPPLAAAPKASSPVTGKPSSGGVSVTPPSSGSSSGATSGAGSALLGSGSSSSGARAIYAPMPKIPEELRENPLRTVAIARFEVAADGEATVKLISPTPYPRLNEILIETLKSWRFFPAVVHGKPVASTFEVRIPVVVD